MALHKVLRPCLGSWDKATMERHEPWLCSLWSCLTDPLSSSLPLFSSSGLQGMPCLLSPRIQANLEIQPRSPRPSLTAHPRPCCAQIPHISAARDTVYDHKQLGSVTSSLNLPHSSHSIRQMGCPDPCPLPPDFSLLRGPLGL